MKIQITNSPISKNFLSFKAKKSDFAVLPATSPENRIINSWHLSGAELLNLQNRALVQKTKHVSSACELARLSDEQWEDIQAFAPKIYDFLMDSDNLLFMIDPEIDIFNDFREGRISRDKFLEYYSLCRILKFELDDSKPEKYAIKNSKMILSSLKASGVESSNTAILLDLAESGKISGGMLDSFGKNSKLSKEAETDLDRFMDCLAEGKNLTDEFVPEFKSKKEALKCAKTGDVIRIKGEKFISIKTAKGIKGLNISAENYLKFFPPVERFTVSQGSVGDCFLLSALFALYLNPQTREKILSIFLKMKTARLTFHLIKTVIS